MAPKLIIADEPTGNIDPEMSMDIMQLFEAINKVNITVVVVTHEHELVHKARPQVRQPRHHFGQRHGCLRHRTPEAAHAATQPLWPSGKRMITTTMKTDLYY